MRANIGILLPNWLGDAVMATPTIRALRQHYGSDARLIGIMRPKVSEVLRGLPWFDEEVHYDRGAWRPDFRLWHLIRRLRPMKLDQLVVLPNSLTSGLVAWFSGARERIGYSRDLRGALLTTRLAPPRDERGLAPISAVDYYLKLAEAAGCRVGDRRVELATTWEDEQAAEFMWEYWRNELPSGSSDRVVAFHCGGAFGATKLWPVESFAALARRCVGELGAAVVILGGPAEQATADEIVRQAADPRVISVAGAKLPIGLMKACIRRSQLLVTTDSGPRHFAAAFGVPTVAMFGPIHPAWSINYNPAETQLYLNLECSPCKQSRCPLGHHHCMRQITVDMVWRAVCSRWERNSIDRVGEQPALRDAHHRVTEGTIG